MEDESASRMDNYEIEKTIGEGSFGQVLKARDKTTGTFVAIKKIHLRKAEDGIPIGVWRELKTMQIAEHRNIVPLLDTFAHGADVVLVMKLMAFNLGDVISADRTPQRAIITESWAKAHVQEILKGVEHLHGLGIIHRDLKPGNILIGQDGSVKLGDFGLSRTVTRPGREFSYQAATRWYRAPEMLFSARTYGPEVDMWGVGCIVGELLTLSPLFPGETDIDQLQRVLSVRGTPDTWIEHWPEVSSLPDFEKISFSPMPKVMMKTYLPGISLSAADLIEHLLQVPPVQRLSAGNALSHSWFFTLPLPARLLEDSSVAGKIVESCNRDCKWTKKELNWREAAVRAGISDI